MKKEINTKITSCKDCPLRKLDNDGMYCDHPYFDFIVEALRERDYWENRIITRDNVYGKNPKLPNNCPLKKEPLIIISKFELIS